MIKQYSIDYNVAVAALLSVDKLLK